MSSPVSLVGFVTIPTVWVISNLGLPLDIWTFGVIPVISIYFLCDHRKLWQAVQVLLRRSSWVLHTGPIIVVLFAILYPLVARIRFILMWKSAVVLVCLLCMIKAFSFEKQMYLTDTYGAVAKYLLWEVVTRFTGEAMWMSCKGEWAYCSPYSRKLVQRDIDHYYNLQKRSEDHEILGENYEFDFLIESCNVHSVYTAASEDRAGGEAGGDQSPASAVICSPMESNHPSPMPGELGPLQFKETGSGSESTTLPTDVETSSPKAERGPLVKDHYTLVSSGVNKVSVSLKFDNKVLEGYTFYNVASDAVAEFKRVLEALKREGNIIFSSLYRNIGSSKPRAHARCYGFGELLDLVLIHRYKLHEVDLLAKYKCVISGHWTLQLQPVVLVGVMLWINYYQLTGPPKSFRTVVILLIFYGLVNLFLIAVKIVCCEQHKGKRLVYFIISKTRPHKLDDWYRFFQVYCPRLTFSNESYGYPYVSSQRTMCFLTESMGCWPVRSSDTGQDTGRYFRMENLRGGLRAFDLRNYQLDVNIDQNRDVVQVDVQMRCTYTDNYCYRRVFFTDTGKAINFIAMMKWLEENSCVGICKEWPESGLMYAYGYKELFDKVLKDGLRPKISTFLSPIDIKFM